MDGEAERNDRLIPVNGRALTPQSLRVGDQIAVGNEAKKVAKLPLIVRAA